MQKGNRFN